MIYIFFFLTFVLQLWPLFINLLLQVYSHLFSSNSISLPPHSVVSLLNCDELCESIHNEAVAPAAVLSAANWLLSIRFYAAWKSLVTNYWAVSTSTWIFFFWRGGGLLFSRTKLQVRRNPLEPAEGWHLEIDFFLRTKENICRHNWIVCSVLPMLIGAKHLPTICNC